MEYLVQNWRPIIMPISIIVICWYNCTNITYFLLLTNSSFMSLNLFLPILALKAHIIEITNIAIGRAQKMILTASCAV